jgi:hypothetical protein
MTLPARAIVCHLRAKNDAVQESVVVDLTISPFSRNGFACADSLEPPLVDPADRLILATIKSCP